MTQVHHSYIYPINLALQALPEQTSVDNLLETFGIRQAVGNEERTILSLNIQNQQRAGYDYAQAPASLALYLQDCTNPQKPLFSISRCEVQEGVRVYGKRNRKKKVQNLYVNGLIGGDSFEVTERLCRLPDEGLRSTVVKKLKSAFPKELGPVLFSTQEFVSLYGTGSSARFRTTFRFFDARHDQSWCVQGVSHDPLSSAVKALSDGFRIALDPRRQNCAELCPA